MTSNLTCPPCLLLSLDPRDQQQLDREVTNFRRQAICTYYQVHLRESKAFLPILLCILRLAASPNSSMNPYRYAAFLARSLSATSIRAY